MDMFSGNLPPDDLCLIFCTYLTDEISGSDRDVSYEHQIAIFGDPDDMIRAVKGGMTGLAIILSHAPIVSC